MGPEIWAVGGGKGGVGKSVVASSLGVALARRGRRVALVDADLGGANLHTLLGVTAPRRTLSDFLARRVESLPEVLAPTPVPGLWLVSGARALMDMANPKHTQKERLLRHVGRLDVEHVIYDLGAGSSFNVLDFFLAAAAGVLVVIPEPTSIENGYHFLKAAFWRRMRNAARPGPRREAITAALETRGAGGVRTARDLVEEVARIDPEAGEALRAEAMGFAPKIVVNQVRNDAHARLGVQMRLAARTYFGTPIDHLGDVVHDEKVLEAVGARRPILDVASGPFARSIAAIVDRLLLGEDARDAG